METDNRKRITRTDNRRRIIIRLYNNTTSSPEIPYIAASIALSTPQPAGKSSFLPADFVLWLLFSSRILRLHGKSSLLN
jgi:hypothetical protein